MRSLISSLFVLFAFYGVSFGATICVDIPDVQIPYVQNIANKEGFVSSQVYLQSVVTAAVNSWQKQQDDAKLVAMKDMMQALSPAGQIELAAVLIAKSQAESAAKLSTAKLSTGGVAP